MEDWLGPAGFQAVALVDDLLALASRMGELDKVLFPVDARQIDWSVYLRKIHLAGLNRYALKERKVYSLRSAKARKKAA